MDAFILGTLVGAILFFAIDEAIRRKGQGDHEHDAPLNEYACWLERECWVRPHGRPEWKRHVVVAVGHKGAVCVRDAEHMSGKGYWIKKENVSWRVRWEDPGIA